MVSVTELGLVVMVSNKNPVEVCHAWLDGISEIGGFPVRTISDYGTETGSTLRTGFFETLTDHRAFSQLKNMSPF